MSPDLVRVFFDEDAWGEELRETSARGARAAEAFRKSVERAGGIDRRRVAPCSDVGKDGTHLPGCAKLYLPEPNPDLFGAVFKLGRDHNGVVLTFIAFGVRHRTRTWWGKTVYERAHFRLHGRWP